MSDPASERRAKRELTRLRKPWLEVMAHAESLAAQEGLAFEARNPGHPEYQICRLTGDGVRLVVYPHRQTNYHQHARVRNENSANPAFAATLMKRLGLTVKYGGWPVPTPAQEPPDAWAIVPNLTTFGFDILGGPDGFAPARTLLICILMLIFAIPYPAKALGLNVIAPAPCHVAGNADMALRYPAFAAADIRNGILHEDLGFIGISYNRDGASDNEFRAVCKDVLASRKIGLRLHDGGLAAVNADLQQQQSDNEPVRKSVAEHPSGYVNPIAILFAVFAPALLYEFWGWPRHHLRSPSILPRRVIGSDKNQDSE